MYKIGFVLPIKRFVVINKHLSALIDVPLRIKQRSNAEKLHKNDYVILCNRAIHFDVNTLKRIQSSVFLHHLHKRSIKIKVKYLDCFSGNI